MSSQLTVALRVRPISEEEKLRKHFQCVVPLDNKRILLVDPEKFENNILRQNRQYERHFSYDATFGPRSTQVDVHMATTAKMVEYVVLGYNATVFAYGATGSGKTYTMIGTRENPGLMSLLTQSLYEKIDSKRNSVYLSYLEIYNENIRDLLNPFSGILDLMEDEKGNVQVPGLSTVIAPSSTRILQLLQEGNARRTKEATAVNKSSSRSHALLQVLLLKNNVPHGKLFLIDLAGSERASQTKNRGQRLKEGAAINRSLLALGNVINSLSSGNKGRYVNYRDSKLTRLLKDSLGGNSKTCMIAHVTPSSANYEETYNTLVYASRAMNITTRLTRNRPVSADQPYSDAIKEMRRMMQSTSDLTHASSTNQLSDKSGSERLTTYRSSRAGGDQRIQSRAPRKFSSLFNSLKEQYIVVTDKQQKLMERLLKANQEAVETEMSRTSKIAILNAWSKQSNDVKNSEKTVESISRLRADVEEQGKRLNQLAETRSKIEKALRKGNETAKSIGSRLRTAAKDAEQIEMVDLISKMAKSEAEKMSIKSDWALQNLRLKRTNNSLMKMQRYEAIADKLIDGSVEEVSRTALQQEYRIIKNQVQLSMLPLRQNGSTVSWNTQLFSIAATPQSRDSDDFGKTFRVKNFRELQQDDCNSPFLPRIYETNFRETQSDSEPERPSTMHLPSI